ERMVAGDESGRAGARAVAARCVDACFDDARITREAEVVVARERDELPGSALGTRRCTPVRYGEPAAKPARVERPQLLGRECVERRGRARGYWGFGPGASGFARHHGKVPLVTGENDEHLLPRRCVG